MVQTGQNNNFGRLDWDINRAAPLNILLKKTPVELNSINKSRSDAKPNPRHLPTVPHSCSRRNLRREPHVNKNRRRQTPPHQEGHSHVGPLLQNRPLFQTICLGSLWAWDNRWLLSRVQWLAGPAGGTGAFCPGWRHQPGQKARVAFCPGWNHQPRQKSPLFVPVGASNRDKRPWAPYTLPSPPARAIQLTYFLAVLGSG